MKDFHIISEAIHVSYDLITEEDNMSFSKVNDYFALVLFESGEGTHVIDAVEYKVHPYQAHLIFPGQIHKLELTPGTVGHRLLINSSYFQIAYASTYFSAFNIRYRFSIALEPEYFQKVLSELLVIKSELHMASNFEDLIYLRCNIIINLLKRQTEARFSDQSLYKSDTIIHQFQTLVEQYFHEHKSVTFYASQLNVTANYLSILCNRRFKMSAQAIIHDRVIIEAQKLIKTRDLSIKEIAFLLGFNEPAYFSSFFKSKMGVTARHYKKHS